MQHSGGGLVAVNKSKKYQLLDKLEQMPYTGDVLSMAFITNVKL